MPGSAFGDIVGNPDTAAADMQGRHNETRARLADLEAGLSHPNLTAHEIMGLATQAALDAHASAPHGGGGGVLPADYVLTRSGATYTLTNGLTGAKSTGTEPGALMQQAITALGLPAGEIVLAGRENFDWGSVPTVPAGITGRLTIRSIGPRVNLSTNGPRFLDPAANPPAGSTFRNLSLIGIVLDATAIQGDTRGHHLLFGNARAGVLYAQINFAGIRVLRCKVLHGRTSDTEGSSGQNGLYFATHQTAAGQPQNFIRDILVDDFEVTGCMQAVAVVSFKSGTWTGDPDIWADGIIVRNWRHDRGVVPAGFVLGGTHVHIGGRGMRVGRAIVENGYGFGSQDVGVEINNFQDALIRNIEVEEYNGFAIYLHNFLIPVRLRNQKAHVQNVSGRHLASRGAVTAANAASLVCSDASPGLALGDVSIEGVNYYRNIARMADLNGIGLRIEGEHRSISVEDVSVEVEGINHTSTTEQAYPKLITINPANLTPVKLRNVQARASGSAAAGAAYAEARGIDITGSLVLDADVRVGLDIAGAADFSLRAVELGRTTSTIKGRIKVRLLPMSETKPIGVNVKASSTLTIPTRLDIVDSDFSSNASTQSQDIAVGAGNEQLVHRRPGSVWKVAPAPVAVTVGASPFTYRNLSGFRQQVAVRGGTVTEVAFSRDGVSWTAIALATNVLVTLENGEHLRVAYSAVPSVIAIPVV